MENSFDVVIAGGGIIGLAIANSLLIAEPKLKVIVLEKESILGAHASGRNSGVIHAGFYYHPESLKAKFCRDGNRALRDLAERHSIEVRDVGKVVVTKNIEEVKALETLFERGLANEVELEFLEEKELKYYEPLAKTHGAFLWSPTTAVSDPTQIINALASEVLERGGKIHFSAEVGFDGNLNIVLDEREILSKHFVNAAGSQADRIAHKFGLGLDYSLLPFMGMYRASDQDRIPIKRLVYPVPHKLNPFLGVHLTLTLDLKVKIGPTAIPVLGREQYGLVGGWNLADTFSTLGGLGSMLQHGAHDLPEMIRSESPKIMTKTLVREAAKLVPSVALVKKWRHTPPGIRSQLIHRPTGLLEQDFIVKQSSKSTHILNAVSPGWTSSIPFGAYVSKLILAKL